MTRETKVGIIVACSFLCLVAAVYYLKKNEAPAADLSAAEVVADENTVGKGSLPIAPPPNGPGNSAKAPLAEAEKKAPAEAVDCVNAALESGVKVAAAPPLLPPAPTQEFHPPDVPETPANSVVVTVPVTEVRTAAEAAAVAAAFSGLAVPRVVASTGPGISAPAAFPIKDSEVKPVRAEGGSSADPKPPLPPLVPGDPKPPVIPGAPQLPPVSADTKAPLLPVISGDPKPPLPPLIPGDPKPPLPTVPTPDVKVDDKTPPPVGVMPLPSPAHIGIAPKTVEPPIPPIEVKPMMQPGDSVAPPSPPTRVEPVPVPPSPAPPPNTASLGRPTESVFIPAAPPSPAPLVPVAAPDLPARPTPVPATDVPAPAPLPDTSSKPPISVAPMRPLTPVGQVREYQARDYVVQKNETYATLSNTFYGDPKYAGALEAWLKSHGPMAKQINALNLVPGDRILIPTQAADLLP